jgi:hypothetical protein
MIRFKRTYCVSFFKAILLVVGLIFLVAQSSFKFYRLASFPFRLPAGNATPNGASSKVATELLNRDKQVEISLLLDKRYDFKHVFISPSPFLRLATLPVESNKYCFASHVSFAAGVDRPASMRGPPNMF